MRRETSHPDPVRYLVYPFLAMLAGNTLALLIAALVVGLALRWYVRDSIREATDSKPQQSQTQQSAKQQGFTR